MNDNKIKSKRVLQSGGGIVLTVACQKIKFEKRRHCKWDIRVFSKSSF